MDRRRNSEPDPEEAAEATAQMFEALDTIHRFAADETKIDEIKRATDDLDEARRRLGDNEEPL